MVVSDNKHFIFAMDNVLYLIISDTYLDTFKKKTGTIRTLEKHGKNTKYDITSFLAYMRQ